jgi:hypothetical protein
MAGSILAHPEILAPRMGGRVGVALRALEEAKALENEAAAMLLSVASPTSPPQGGDHSFAHGFDSASYLSVIEAAAEVSRHYQEEAAAVRALVNGRSLAMKLSDEEKAGRRHVESAEIFERQGPVDFHNGVMSRYRVGALQAEETEARRVIIVDFAMFHQYCSGNEPSWRRGAQHAGERRELAERAERAIKREAEEDMGLREALFLQFHDELEDIERRHPPRPSVVGVSSSAGGLSAAGTGYAGGAGSGSIYDGYGVGAQSSSASAYPAHVSHATTPSPQPSSSSHYDPYSGSSYPSAAASSRPSMPYAGASPSAAEEAPKKADFAHRALRDDDLRLLERRPFRADFVESVDASHNHIRTLDCLPVLRQATSLDLSHNSFADSGGVVRDLKAKCQRLRELRLSPNPCAPVNLAPEMHANYRAYVVANLPSLTVLDGLRVSDGDRERARRLFPNGMPGSAPSPPPQAPSNHHYPQATPQGAYGGNSYSQHGYGGAAQSNTGYGNGGATNTYGSRGTYGSSARGGGVYGSNYGR